MGRISTRKRGNKKVSWYYSFEASDGGKRKRIEKGGFATEKEALEAGTIAQARYLRGDISITSEKVRIQDFMGSWLESKKFELRPASFAAYALHSRRFIAELGNMNIQDIRPRDVDRAVRALAGRGLSHSTIMGDLSVIKAALDYAVYPCELMQSNPARFIKVPKNAPRSVLKRYVISDDKLKELLDDCPFGHPFHIPILLAYNTGMRMGETLGLTWDCVDFENRTISVERQLIYPSSEVGCIFSEPKTKTSRRKILVDENLMALLRQWKTKQAANEMEAGGRYFHVYESKDGGAWQVSKGAKMESMTRRALVCTYPNGKHVQRTSLVLFMTSHGLNFHSLRHTHATICAEYGAPPKGLAGRLGHSNTQITENLYTHETRRMQDETLRAFTMAREGKKDNVGMA